MWKRASRGLEMMFRALQPEIDEDGIYFLCVGCGYRNKLVKISGDSGETVLAQVRDLND